MQLLLRKWPFLHACRSQSARWVCCGSVWDGEEVWESQSGECEADASEGDSVLMNHIYTLPFAKCHVSTSARGQSTLIWQSKHCGAACPSSGAASDEVYVWIWSLEMKKGSTQKEELDDLLEGICEQFSATSMADGACCGKSQTGVKAGSGRSK